MAEPPLLIVGASVRAAAHCARRAGFAPWCIDLFGDEDLRAIADVRVLPIAEYPHGILPLAAAWAPADAPAMYTGALENHEDVVAALARTRQLWGCPPEALPRTSLPLSPETLSASAEHLRSDRTPADGSWLLKPIRSAGGRGIRRYFGEALTSTERAECVLQKCIDGESLSAVFLADSERTVLVGVSRQLVGEAWLNAKPFGYCGSVGPFPPDELMASGFVESAEAYAGWRGYRGLFGADLIRADDGFCWLIEINPRITASAELHELACGEPLLRWHGRCFTEAAPLRDFTLKQLTPRRRLGKAIWFLPRSFPPNHFMPKLKRCEAQLRSADHWAIPDLADIPAPGMPLIAGQPLLTLFVESPQSECMAMLETRLRAKVSAFVRELHQALGLDDGVAAE